MSSVHEIRSDRPGTDPAGPTGRLAAWLAGLRLEDVPERVRQRAIHLLLDGIGCALVGARLPWSRPAVESLCRLEGAGPAQLIGWNRAAPPLAALLNSTFIQGFELDDFHPFAPLHSASLVLLACAQADGKRGGPITGVACLKGAIAGFEVGPRVGLGLMGSKCCRADGIPERCSVPTPPLLLPERCSASIPPGSRMRWAWREPSRAA
jgi:2-methylcitrate dehydratase PrpD